LPKVWPDEPKMRLTVLRVKDLDSLDTQIITARVFPSPVWCEGEMMVIRGHRDFYELHEVRKRMSGFERLFVINLKSAKLPFLPTEANKVQRV